MRGGTPVASEDEAMRAVVQGDARGLEFLVAQHELRALRIAVAITGDRSTAEEAVAEAFFNVHKHAGRFEPGRQFGPWFTRIVVNEAVSVTRRARRAERLQALLGRQVPRSVDPVEVAEGNELRRDVIAAVHSLSPNERAAITLRYLLDLDERSVAEILGWPLGTLKTRLHRARLHLRGRLGDRLGHHLEVAQPQQELLG